MLAPRILQQDSRGSKGLRSLRVFPECHRGKEEHISYITAKACHNISGHLGGCLTRGLGRYGAHVGHGWIHVLVQLINLPIELFMHVVADIARADRFEFVCSLPTSMGGWLSLRGRFFVAVGVVFTEPSARSISVQGVVTH